MDLWEANREAQALTPHPCNAVETTPCTGAQCSGDLAVGICDQPGCDFNPYRNGRKDFYGVGPGKTIDTRRPFTVVTQFQTQNGKDDGELVVINRFYKQEGRFYLTPAVNVTGFPDYFNYINTEYCDAENKAFGGGQAQFKARGGLKQMGKALGRGMVLVFSIWTDGGSYMQWLDGQTGDASTPGNLRGPCDPAGGSPDSVRQTNVDAAVTWSNIKFGEFGTTF
jgi:cellulose 1,4-beta-cellobiosidase